MEAIIFIGIPASGKSTFYEKRFASTHGRINLDTLKTRKREWQAVEACLLTKRSFVVDNTNMLRTERARYIVPAREAGYRIIGYYFRSSLKEALQRNRERIGKSKIPDVAVMAKHNKLEIPSLAEGFDELYAVIIDTVNGEFVVREWSDEI